MDILQAKIDEGAATFTYTAKNGIVYLVSLQETTMDNYAKYLEQHRLDGYSIRTNKDGRFYTRVPDTTGKKKTKTIIKTTKEEIEQEIIHVYQELDDNPTLQEVFKAYINKALDRNQIAQNTAESYTADYKRYMQVFGKNRIRALNVNDFIEFIEDTFYRMSLNKKQFDKLKHLVKSIINYSSRQEYIDFSYTTIKDKLEISKKDIANNKKPEKEQIYYEDEQKLLVNYCENSTDPRDKAILISFGLGLRVSELVALKWENVNGNFINIRNEEKQSRDENGKKILIIEENTGKTPQALRTLPILPVVQRAIDFLREQNLNSTYIIVNKKGGRYTQWGFNKHLKVVCEKIGIDYRSCQKLRKTILSEQLMNNVPLQVVSKFAGHSDETVTLRNYTYSTARVTEIPSVYQNIAILN